MRAPKNEATGTSGESEVMAQFERLGWAAALDSRHDTGTDLYLRPRDSRRFELGAVMGAQVKTGGSYFSSTKRDEDGKVSGWWFTEGDWEHFEYWLRHALPHLVILRDQEKDISYWAHVTREAVVPTGKGAKIFVPASQTIDAANNEVLSDVALTQLPTPTWDGTAWTGALHLIPQDEIRHALLTPRLVAPHPNLPPAQVTGPEALAMQVLFRDEIKRILEENELSPLPTDKSTSWQGLSLAEAHQSTDWCWRATAAIHQEYYEGESTHLLALCDNTVLPSERAAASVLACVHHFEENDPDSALRVLHDALEYDDYSPVDHAWLQAQRARALLEIGREREAFDLAMKTQRIHREAPSDVTAAAIAGACALTSFRASGWMHGDLSNVVQRSDNPASWWRSQKISWGLSAHLDEQFRDWYQDESVHLGGRDTAYKQLVSASLMASFVADQDGWRGAQSALGKYLLITSDPTDNAEAIAARLSLVCRSGDGTAVSNATRHIVRRGPVMAARIAAGNVAPARSTRSSALADLELVTAAGDVLDPTHAEVLCKWALETLKSPDAYITRTNPSFILQYKLIDLIISLVHTLTEDTLHKVINHFLSQPAIKDDGAAQTLARLIHRIPSSAWREEDRKRAGDRAAGDARFLREAFLQIASPAVETSREEVLRLARSGDLMAFEAISDVSVLPADAVTALSDALCSAVDETIKAASIGSFRYGGLDVGHALCLLGAKHPSSERWDSVCALLTAPRVRSDQIRGALKVIAALGDGLADPFKKALGNGIAPLRHRTPVPDLFGRDVDIRGLAAQAWAATTDASRRRDLVRELLLGEAVHREAAARIIGRFGDAAESELLLALAADSHEAVRDSALNGLSTLVATGRATEGVAGFLSTILETGGVRSGSAIVAALARPSSPANVAQLLSVAAAHPSAQIRAAARSATKGFATLDGVHPDQEERLEE